MKQTLVPALLMSAILGVVGCTKEEPEGTAEQMGKKMDEAAESVREDVAAAGEAAQEQAAEAKSELGAAMEEEGKKMQE
jgi:hypothetical protein